jgi:large subunit ribosomal protein L21
MSESSYAVIRTGGKQYRVEEGSTLLVELLPEEEGATVSLEPLLYHDTKNTAIAADELKKVKVSAKVVGHERGPKLRVVKFKPKRGYKRRTGHRQDLTRLLVTELSLDGKRAPAAAAKKAAAPKAAAGSKAADAKPKAAVGKAAAAKPKASAAKAESKPAAAKPKADVKTTPKTSDTDKPRSTSKETPDGA